MSEGISNMSDFDHFSNMSSNSAVESSQKPEAPGSNRDSLNLDDFEKVEADQLPPVAQGFQAAAGLMGDLVSQASSAAPDSSSFAGGVTLDSSPAFDTGLLSSAAPPFASDPFRLEATASDPFAKDTAPSDAFASFSLSADPLLGKAESSEAPSADAPASTQADTGPSSAPPPAVASILDDLPPSTQTEAKPVSPVLGGADDVLAAEATKFLASEGKGAGQPHSEALASFDPFSAQPPAVEVLAEPLVAPESFAPAPKREPSPEPLAKEAPLDPLAKGEAELFGLKEADPFAVPKEPSPEPFARREPSPDPFARREPSPVRREPTPPQIGRAHV